MTTHREAGANDRDFGTHLFGHLEISKTEALARQRTTCSMKLSPSSGTRAHPTAYIPATAIANQDIPHLASIPRLSAPDPRPNTGRGSRHYRAGHPAHRCSGSLGPEGRFACQLRAWAESTRSP